MSNSKVYCGSKNKLPSGYSDFGDLLQCVDKTQIRRFGMNKVDPKVVELRKKDNLSKLTRSKAIVNMTRLRGLFGKLSRDLATEKQKKKNNKKFDQNLLDSLEKQVPQIRVKLQSAIADFRAIEAKEGGLNGGKLSAQLLKKLVNVSKLNTREDIGDYIVDRELSTNWVQVYHNPSKNWTILMHRGTTDLADVWVDAQLAINYKNNDRFRASEKIQKLASKKYDPKRTSTVGSSLGAVLAEDFGQDTHEVIAISKPVTPGDLISGKQPGENQYDVRSKTDPLGIFKNLQPHKNDITVTSVAPFNPEKSHIGSSVMDALMKERGSDVMVGHGLTYKKLRIRELRDLIKNERKSKKVKISKYPVTGKNKKQLYDMLIELHQL